MIYLLFKGNRLKIRNHLSSIENVVGSDQDDVILGNSQQNTLIGGAGNDILVGGYGEDTAEYTGNISDYAVIQQEGGTIIVYDMVEGRDGVDQVSGVEKLIFADELIKFLLNILLSILIGLIAASLGIFIGKNI